MDKESVTRGSATQASTSMHLFEAKEWERLRLFSKSEKIPNLLLNLFPDVRILYKINRPRIKSLKNMQGRVECLFCGTF